MKYIEELVSGDTFIKDNHIFLLTADFKRNGSRLVYSLKNGHALWLKGSDAVDIYPLYTLDENNNVVSIKNDGDTPPNFSAITNLAH